MPTPAPPRDGGYRIFPPEYFALLDRAEAMRTDLRIGPFTKAQAIAARRSFYRFRTALNRAADEGDTYASNYSNIGNTLRAELDEPETGRHYLVISHSPLVAAIRRMEETAS